MSAAWCGAFVALGSNVGDRTAALESALLALESTAGVRVEAVSRFHCTAPVGGPAGQGDFLNAVARVSTRLDAEDLLRRLLAIEADHGRERDVRNGPRTLDLDLLWMEDVRRATGELTLPHPRMDDRLFVLEPLAEIAPDFVLPGSGQSIRARIDSLRAPEPAR